MDKRQKFKGELRISRVRVFRLIQEQKYAGLGLPHCAMHLLWGNQLD